MGLFGLTTAEAIILAQREKNSAENYRHRQEMKFESKRYNDEQKYNEDRIKLEKEKIAQNGTEARQLEPFIILNVFDVWPKETISIRPSDIKIMNGKIKESEYNDYDSPAPWGGWYKKTTKEPYTELQLWDGRKIKVNESVEDIQNKVNEVIEKMVDLQARTLAKIINNE